MNDFESRARKAAEAVRNHGGDDDRYEQTLRRSKTSAVKRSAPVAAGLAIVLIAGVAIFNPSNPSQSTQERPFELASALKPFAGCDDTLAYFKRYGPEYFTSNGGVGIGPPVFADGREITTVEPQAASPDASTGSRDSAVTASPGYSQTNVQERGVDEPDIVKTDGRRVVAIANGRVQLIDATGDAPVVRSTLPITDAAKLLMSGDRLLVYRGQYAFAVDATTETFAKANAAQVELYDIADISNPKLLQSLRVDGSLVDSRLVGSKVRLIGSFSPDLNIQSPSYDANGNLDAASTARLNSAIAASKVEDWTPTYSVLDASGKSIRAGELVSCEHLGRPENFSGVSTVSVMSFDMNNGFDLVDTAGVIGEGQTVYATVSTLYVSTTSWTKDGFSPDTNIHKFAGAPGEQPTYKGSGQVTGSILPSYALSERDGVLRVASTTATTVGWKAQRSQVEGIVTTLEEKDGSLRQLGRVGGLGAQDNESIKSVRFIDDKAYVVTFRQTDPLYVIDLADPKTPKVTGELKIPGYSGYLHPVGKNLLLGVGRSGASAVAGSTRAPLPGSPGPAVAEDESTTGSGGGSAGSSSSIDPVAPDIAPAKPVDPDAGVGAPISSLAHVDTVQFSLFDVSDPANPKRVATQDYGVGTANAEYDPMAFLYWEPKHKVVAPLQSYSVDGTSKGQFSGAAVMTVDDSKFVNSTKFSVSINTNEFYSPVVRVFVIGNSIYSLTNTGLQVNDLDSLAEKSQVEFAANATDGGDTTKIGGGVVEAPAVEKK